MLVAEDFAESMSGKSASHAAASEDQRSGSATLALLCSVNFVVIMDAQIVILALPSIQRGLGFSGSGSAQWVLSAYLLCFGGLLLLGGRAGDIYGRRRLFLGGTAAFALASLCCGLAPSPGALIAARAVQGLSAAVMAPTALAILAATFQEEEQRNRALALWGGVGGVGATGALLIGGVLTSAVGWRWIFFINVPVAVVILLLAPRLFRESRTGGAGTIDVLGAVTLTGGLSIAIYSIVEAPTVGWLSLRTLGLLFLAFLLLGAFVLTEQRMARPLVPIGLLRSRLLVAGNGAVFAAGMCAWGVGLISSEYAQRELGYSPIQFGLGSLALTVGAMLGAFAGQMLLPKLGGYLMALMALIMTGGCALLTTLSPHGSYLADLFAGLAVFGFAMGAITVAGSVAALREVDEADQGVASGINTAAFQLGGALGSAVVASVLAAVSEDAIHGLNAAARTTVALGAVAIAFTLLVTGRTARRLRAS